MAVTVVAFVPDLDEDAPSCIDSVTFIKRLAPLPRIVAVAV
ncbi:hypothetical protein [Streptomyces sp. D2-8]|nr:hypothetical protein [Streptomyces sp. D2-8]